MDKQEFQLDDAEPQTTLKLLSGLVRDQLITVLCGEQRRYYWSVYHFQSRAG